MKIYWKLILSGLLMASQSAAQSPTLDAYVQEALIQNLSIQDAQLKRTKQINKIAQAKRLWGPSVDANASYLLATGGRVINFPIGDLFNPVYSTLNQVTGSTQFPTDLENEEIQLTPNNFIDVQIGAQMPLLNSSIRYNQKIQQALLALEDLNIQLTEQDVKYQVKTAYFNYLKSLEGVKTLDTSSDLLEEVLAFNKKLVKFDKATDEIVSDVEYQIENLKSQKIGLEEQQVLAQAYFNLLLNRALDTAIEADTNLVKQIAYETRPIADLQNIALQNRLGLQQITAGEAVNQLNQERIRKERQPTLGLSGSVGVQTENFNFDNGGPLFILGLGMQWNIFDNGQRNTRIEELKIDRDILANNRALLTQQSNIEVVQMHYGMQSLLSRMQAETAAERSANRSLTRVKTRYKNENALLIELLQAQNRLTTARLSKVLTQYDYLLKQAELEKILGK